MFLIGIMMVGYAMQKQGEVRKPCQRGRGDYPEEQDQSNSVRLETAPTLLGDFPSTTSLCHRC